MKKIHIGHHFFGAGNLGDDFMLAGFLVAMEPWLGRAEFSCCVPHPRELLSRRFPQICWLPYDETTRRRAIASSDVWLGLGGSPFQCTVSSWFIDHLAEERCWCAAANKPMYFLGVGGQDPAAYLRPEIRAICAQATGIWTRDTATAEALYMAVPSAAISVSADLAHVFFSTQRPPSAVAGRLTATFNFDYGVWPNQGAALAALESLPACERIWLAQETRLLPGAEQQLFSQVSENVRRHWRLQIADTGETTMAEVLRHWPSSEWLIASRYHATIAGAWAGSRAIVIATNDKIRGIARDLGYPSLAPDDDFSILPFLWRQSKHPARSVLLENAKLAHTACSAFAQAIGLH
ncbi:MAG: hypothetical protein HZA31_05690 [Opitutae bacterium]|nr:hypothetical protein [Opitutae bacterium]